MGTARISIALPDGIDRASLCGPQDCILRGIEGRFGAQLSLRSGEVGIAADSAKIDDAARVVADVVKMVQEGRVPTLADVERSAEVLANSPYDPSSLRGDVLMTYRGRAIRPKTSGQKRYCDAIRANTVTFGIGPAGTGKTYLAMALALAALQRKEIGRIILTRPVVEAGENLGFLPGTLTEKVDPYVRPLYDALFDMTDREKGAALMGNGVIEIAPLAFMRGRTFNDAFLILDEAQNTTPEQMKMFLTRLGFGSKMVVTGDTTQTDLPFGASGLLDAREVLEGMDDIAFCDFTGADVVRHNLVARIVSAYDDARAGGAARPGARPQENLGIPKAEEYRRPDDREAGSAILGGGA